MIPSRIAKPAAVVAAICGAALLALNAAGLVLVPLRAPSVDGYVDFAGSETLSYEAALSRLASLDTGDAAQYAAGVTRVFHEGIAHLQRADVERQGPEYYRMTVPASENFVLFALRFLKPDTYRDYEFCSYRKALQRGIGRCGQQSLAVVDFLSSRGFETGFVDLDGAHALATVDVGDGDWYLLDPDYGGVIPMPLEQARSRAAELGRYYWNDAARERGLLDLYREGNNRVIYGGPAARWGRACTVERVAYVLKWLIPLGLLAPGMLVLARKRTRRL